MNPTNILLDETGKTTLTDSGLSLHMDENGIAEQGVNYRMHADPEWYLHSGRTVQSDIYQIGLTIYRLCNGVGILSQQLGSMSITTIDELKQNVLKGKFPDRKYFMPHIPKKLQKVILKALEVDSNKRYNNTIEMMNDLGIIDNNLDWIFTGNMMNPYTKADFLYQYDIFVKPNKDIDCFKTNLSSGKKSKISRYCIKCISEKDFGKNLTDVVGGLN